ncbi:MAG: hypothetical protein ACRD02_08650 [Acidimicrobiia bacterium]
MGTEAAERLHDTLLQVVEVWAVDQVIHEMAVGGAGAGKDAGAYRWST